MASDLFLASDRGLLCADATPTHVAAGLGDLETELTVLDVDTRHRGSTPLHAAAELGDTAAVRLLLAARCDAAARDRRGRTALHLAAEGGRFAVVEALVPAETPAQPAERRRLLALLRSEDEEGLTALRLAVGADDVTEEVARYLAEREEALLTEADRALGLL